MKQSLLKSKILRNVILVFILSFVMILTGTYLAIKFIGPGYSDDEFVLIKEEDKAEIQDNPEAATNIKELRIYYTEDFKTLSPEIVLYNYAREDNHALASFIIKRIFLSPDSPKLHSLFSEKFKLNGVFIINDQVLIDLDLTEIKDYKSSVQLETLMVYSIVNSICENIHDIESVQILVNGAVAETLLGHIDISQPLLPQINLYK